MKDLKLATALSRYIFVLGIVVSALSIFILVLCVVGKEPDYRPYLSLFIGNAILWITYLLLKHAIKVNTK
jgi:hypothetical protein